MAIAIAGNLVDTTSDNSTAGHLTYSVTVSSGVDVLAFAFQVADSTGGTPSDFNIDGVTVGGNAATIVQSWVGTYSANRYGVIALGYIVSPSSGANTIDIDFAETGTVVRDADNLYCWEITGANTSSVIDASSNNGGTPESGTFNLSLTTNNANSLIVMVAGVADTGTPSDATLSWASGTEDVEYVETYFVVSFGHKTTTTAGSNTLGVTETLGTSGIALAMAINEATSNVTVTPAAASATSAATAPTVVKGSQTVAPSAASSTSSAVAPTVVKGSQTVAPSAASSTSSATGPTIAISSTQEPAAAQATAGATAPTIATSSTQEPAAAQATASATAPTVVKSSVSITPAAAQATTGATAPTVAISSTQSPDAAQATTGATVGAVLLGSASVSPSAATAASSATIGAAIRGSISITPAAAQATSGASVTLGLIEPAAAQATTSASIGAVIRSSQSITPAAAQATTAAIIGSASGVYLNYYTLDSRGVSFTLSSRTASLTLDDRVTSLTLENK